LEPQLLLLDEPLSALDAQIRKRLQEEFKRLQARIGFTAVFVTHDQEEALVLGDQIAVMQQGRIVQAGLPHQVYSAPANRAVAGFIGNINVLEPDQVARLFGRKTADAWAIHPETIGLSNSAKPGAISTMATIQSRMLLGSTIRYTVAAHGVTLRVDVLSRPSQPPLPPGAEVLIDIDPADLHLLTH
jgi:putative spermidine/putrescine transport system ATP-binding protein